MYSLYTEEVNIQENNRLVKNRFTQGVYVNILFVIIQFTYDYRSTKVFKQHKSCKQTLY